MDTTKQPAAALSQVVNGFKLSQAVYVAAKLGVADLLAEGPRSSGDLARAVGAHGPTLFRVLRLLASAGIFTEVEPDRFALTAEADVLRADVAGSLRQSAIFAMELEYPSWGELLHAVRTGGVAFDRAFGASVWAYLAQDPDANALFNGAMTAGSQAQVGAIVAAYDFPRDGTIVDIGGGQGALLAAILRARPGARGILFDLPHVVAGARARLEAEGVAEERCAIVAGNAFAAVPGGGDVYVLKNLIHCWDDGPARALLTACRRAMQPSGRLVLLDGVMPAGRASPSAALVAATSYDVNMLVWQGGRIRTADEYERLLNAAGFALRRILPTGTALNVIEGVPD